jgi:murein DD-endopeptidase MepM/ murein hydrolase activator NlpD
MAADYLNIIVTPEKPGRTWHLRVRAGTLKIMAGCVVFCALLLVTGVLSYWKVATLALQTKRIKKQNVALAAECQKVHELAAVLKRAAAADQQLRKIAGGMIDLTAAPVMAVYSDAELDRSLRSRPGTELLPSRQAPVTAPAPVAAAAPSPAGYGRSSSFSWPLYGGWISNEFTAASGGKPKHQGIDLAVKEGTPVKAAGSGVVSFCGWTSDLGNVIVIDHGNGFLTRYGHNSRNTVEKGDIVKQGKIIAFAGNSGRSSAPHLHFEIWKDGVPVNPRDYLLR